jgi:hypothetical protein
VCEASAGRAELSEQSGERSPSETATCVAGGPLRGRAWLPSQSEGQSRRPAHSACMYDAYMPNKTISVPEDVLPIIDGLGVPFSTWVADQLRHHAATHSALGFAQQLLADAELANAEPPTAAESLAALERMERSAPW